MFGGACKTAQNLHVILAKGACKRALCSTVDTLWLLGLWESRREECTTVATCGGTEDIRDATPIVFCEQRGKFADYSDLVVLRSKLVGRFAAFVWWKAMVTSLVHHLFEALLP